MADMIKENYTILSNIILITRFIGCIGGLFIRALLCIQAVIYKRITDNGKTTLLTAFAIQIVNKYKISLDWICGRK